jgi:hypothetical protein
MMNLVLFGWFTTTDVFQTLTNIDMKDMLYRERLKAIQDDMLPFGFIEGAPYNSHKYSKDDDGNIWLEQEWKNSI